MATIKCPNCGRPTCNTPKAAVLVVRGRFSLIDNQAVDGLALMAKFDLSTARPLTFAIPPHIIHAAYDVDEALGKDLDAHRHQLGGGSEKPSDGLIVTCSCGHGPFILDTT
jgi:hypothetical protein